MAQNGLSFYGMKYLISNINKCTKYFALIYVRN